MRSALAALGLFGCGLGDGYASLDSVVDPQDAPLDTPGQRLVPGTFSDLAIDVRRTPLEPAHHLAIRHDANHRTLVVLPGTPSPSGPAPERTLATAEMCEIGKVSRYQIVRRDCTFDPVGEHCNEAMVAYLESEDENGRGTLHFSSLDCTELLAPVAGVELPRVQFSGPVRSNQQDMRPARFRKRFVGERRTNHGFLVDSNDGSLSFIDLRGDRVVRVAEAASRYLETGEHLWTIEGGELVLRDAELVELGRFGSNVGELVELSSTSGTTVALPLIDEMVAFVDQGRLFVVGANEREPRLLSDDACGVGVPLKVTVGFDARALRSVLESSVIAFFSPCSERRLVVADALGSGSVAYPGAQRAVNLVETPPDPQYGLFYFSDFDETTQTGTLWAALPGAEPERLGERVRPPRSNLSNAYLFDWDGEQGRLVRLTAERDREGALRIAALELADRVARYGEGLGGGPWLLLRNVVEGGGDLVYLSAFVSGSAPKTQLLGQGVPSEGGADFYDWRAITSGLVLSDYEGGVGTLYSYDVSLESTELIAKQVLPESATLPTYTFDLGFLRGVAYLGAPAANGYGTFKMFYGAEERLIINWYVGEFHVTESSLVYSVVAGDEPGIWSASLFRSLE